MTDSNRALVEAEKAIIAAGYNPATAQHIASIVLASLPAQEVAGLVEGEGKREALLDLEYANGVKAGYRIGYRDGSRPDGCPAEPGEQSLASMIEARQGPALAALASSRSKGDDQSELAAADNYRLALLRNAEARIAKVIELEEAGTCSRAALAVVRDDRDRALTALGRQTLAAFQSRQEGK